MSDSTYTYDLEEITNEIERRNSSQNHNSDSLNSEVRKILYDITEIDKDVPLLVYGEQADPMIKHVGKQY